MSMCLLRGSSCYWIDKKDLRDYTQDDLSIFCFMSFACVYVFTYKFLMLLDTFKKLKGLYTR